MIPIYTSDNHFVQSASEAFILANEQRFKLVRNRRGYLREAHLKPGCSLDERPASKIGIAFRQSLGAGMVWALGGVRGSA